MGLQFRIIYKKEVENRVVDAFSTRANYAQDDSGLQLNMVAQSQVVPTWLVGVAAGYEKDENAQKILSALATGEPLEAYTLVDGIIRYKGKIWLGANQEIQTNVMSALHDSPIGWYLGFFVTYRRIKSMFSWPSMKGYIKEFVSSCLVCQQDKTERGKYLGLLLSLPIPEQAWQVVTIDFMSELTVSHNHKYNCIMVVVD